MLNVSKYTFGSTYFTQDANHHQDYEAFLGSGIPT